MAKQVYWGPQWVSRALYVLGATIIGAVLGYFFGGMAAAIIGAFIGFYVGLAKTA
jgi:uncharacterized membrane protein